MSLEAQLQGCTTAVLKLCAILEGANVSIAAPKADAAKPAAQKAAAPTPAAKPTVPAPAVAPKASTVSYDDIKKAANALIVKHGREAFMKVLEGFQLPNAMAAKPEGYPMLLDAIQKASA